MSRMEEETTVRTEKLSDKRKLRAEGTMSGYCYTPLTDIEQEQNGLYNCQRKPKFDVERIRKIQARAAAYEQDPPLSVQRFIASIVLRQISSSAGAESRPMAPAGKMCWMPSVLSFHHGVPRPV